VNTVSTIKKLAAAAGIAGAVGIAAFGLDTGTAAAAPGQHSWTSSSSGSSRHTNKLGTTSGSSSQTGPGVGSGESGGRGTAVPRTWYPEMPQQGG
jgi:hypothetical protein